MEDTLWMFDIASEPELAAMPLPALTVLYRRLIKRAAQSAYGLMVLDVMKDKQ